MVANVAAAGDAAGAAGADLEHRTVVDKALALELEAEQDGNDDGDEEHSELVVVDAAGGDVDGDVAVVGAGDDAGGGGAAEEVPGGARTHTELAQKVNETATKRKLESWLSSVVRDWNRRS